MSTGYALAFSCEEKRLTSSKKNVFPHLVMLLQRHSVEDRKTCQVDEQLGMMSTCKETWKNSTKKNELLAVLSVYTKGIHGVGGG